MVLIVLGARHTGKTTLVRHFQTNVRQMKSFDDIPIRDLEGQLATIAREARQHGFVVVTIAAPPKTFNQITYAHIESCVKDLMDNYQVQVSVVQSVNITGL